MNLGLCIIAYDVDYNRETTENQSLYFKSKNELQAVLKQISTGMIDADIIRTQMETIANRRYLWSIITAKYKKVFISNS